MSDNNLYTFTPEEMHRFSEHAARGGKFVIIGRAIMSGSTRACGPYTLDEAFDNLAEISTRLSQSAPAPDGTAILSHFIFELIPFETDMEVV